MSSSVAEMALEINRRVEDFRQGRTANDDATMMIIRRLP
jgi:serine phosphatase RsbU (regulator of sigma subunit)